MVDIDLKDVKKGRPGEICVRGPTVMKYAHLRSCSRLVAHRWFLLSRGYWNNEKATKESFFDGDWYRTGDIAQIDDEGNHL